MSISPDLSRLADRQHGLLLSRQVTAIAGRPLLRQALSTGALVPVARSVHRLPDHPESWHQRLLGVCLAVEPTPVVVSHRTAADLWLQSDDPEPQIHLSGPRTIRFDRPDVCMHRVRDWASVPLASRHHIPVTPPARTLVDVAVTAPESEIADLIERFVAAGLATRTGLGADARHMAGPGRTGPRRLIAVLEEYSPPPAPLPPTTPAEAHFLALCDAAGFPRPHLDTEVVTRLGPRRVPLGWPTHRLAVALPDPPPPPSGRSTRLPVSELLLADLGWSVLRFTGEHLRHQPGFVRRATARALHATLPLSLTGT